MIRALAIGGLSLGLCTLASAQEINPQINPQLMAHIATIRAIDNHAHVVAPDLARDTGYDALRCDTFEANASALPPANLRFGPDMQAVWKALYGFNGLSDSPDALKALEASQQAVRQKQGGSYFTWILDQARVDVVLANRLTMASELASPRFRWVPYDDALLVPFDTSALRVNPDRKVVYETEEKHLKDYLAALKLTRVPDSLDGYLSQVIAPTLMSQKQRGAVALKFEVAYMRSLDFAMVPREAAAAIYTKYASAGSRYGGDAPNAADYKTLQDFLFHEIAAQAGRLGLPMQIHTGLGCGLYFETRGADPLWLEPLLNDPWLKTTKFVLLHGGSPFERHYVSLIARPNVWVDTSMMELLYSPAEVARTLRPWLEIMPEHVMFGSDAGPFVPGIGWEEATWLGVSKMRKALGLSLSQMLRDGLITQVRAKAIAERVLRGNAVDVYGLK